MVYIPTASDPTAMFTELIALARVCSLSSRVHVITRGAQLVNGDTDVWMASAEQAQCGVWGALRTLRAEQRDADIRCIDVGSTLDPAVGASLRLAIGAIDGGSIEEEVAVRSSGLYVRRLVDSATQVDDLAIPAFRSDAAYVISGGLGGLGLVAAKHLLQHGASTVVLLARSGCVPSEAAELWHELVALDGVTVIVMRCDVASQREVEQVFRELKRRGVAVAGVLHAAGVLADGMLANQTLAQFERVCAAKVTGGWNLHAATLCLPLDSFVTYSSVAASFGSPGQSNYSLANSWMDGLVQGRVQSGLAARSFQWGPWDGVGMAARNDVLRRVRASGVEARDPVRLGALSSCPRWT